METGAGNLLRLVRQDEGQRRDNRTGPYHFFSRGFLLFARSPDDPQLCLRDCPVPAYDRRPDGGVRLLYGRQGGGGPPLWREGICELFSVPDWARSRWHVANFILVIASLVFYILFSDIVGFDLIGTMILFALFASLRKGHLGSSFVSALVATCIIHYVFGHFLRVPLPWGIFENYAFF